MSKLATIEQPTFKDGDILLCIDDSNTKVVTKNKIYTAFGDSYFDSAMMEFIKILGYIPTHPDDNGGMSVERFIKL